MGPAAHQERPGRGTPESRRLSPGFGMDSSAPIDATDPRVTPWRILQLLEEASTVYFIALGAILVVLLQSPGPPMTWFCRAFRSRS